MYCYNTVGRVKRSELEGDRSALKGEAQKTAGCGVVSCHLEPAEVAGVRCAEDGRAWCSQGVAAVDRRMEDVVVLGSSDDEEGWFAGPLGGGARAGSSSAGASAVSGSGVGGERAAAAKTKKPKAKKRASADGGAGAAHPKAKKRAKASKGRVSASWTDSEDENADASSMRQPSIPWAAWMRKPPPTMAFSGNVAQEPPAYWALKKGGSEAANLCDSMGAFAFNFVRVCSWPRSKLPARGSRCMGSLQAPIAHWS